MIIDNIFKMDKIDNKKKLVGAGLVLAGLATLWYLLTRKPKNSD